MKVELLREDWTKLESLTTAIADREGFVAIFVGAEMLEVAQVSKGISDGQISLAGDLTEEQALDLQELLGASEPTA